MRSKRPRGSPIVCRCTAEAPLLKLAVTTKELSAVLLHPDQDFLAGDVDFITEPACKSSVQQRARS